MQDGLRPAAKLAALLLMAGCAGGPPAATATAGDLRLTNGFAYEPIIQASGAAYVEITNRGTTPDTLLGASSPAAAGAMLHGGSMAHVMTLPIPAGGTLALAPGGTHIMLTDFVAMPEAGDSLTLILTFARAGSVTLQLPVRKYGDE
ncbi:MAG: copper chaperone PCu(A)C [Gemmatimonadetes bacterium]|nr:copper chaperone PCu(A)C [Gemmatimonadota bacterium]